MRQQTSINIECSGHNEKLRKKRILIYTIISMLTLIVITRLLALRHGMVLHPDEWVFFGSASSLFFDSPYQVYKTYPEGAFLMQMPFQIFRRLVLYFLHFGSDAQLEGAHLMGRISSVVYFSLGACLGCTFLYLVQKKTLPIILFAGAMVFSLFQIEQSRYGTGEAPSFFLIMAILNLLVLYMRFNKLSLLLTAAFLAGILGAVKYPQLYFILLPICAAFINRHSSKTPLILNIFLVVLCSVAGAVGFSPSVFQPGFLSGIVSRELDAYVTNPNISALGTPWGHLLSLLLYHLFYSDIPFAPVFAIAGIVLLLRRSEKTNATVFFLILIPLIFAGFFIYNLFVPSLFFRTYYMYFCVCILYTSIGLSELFTRNFLKQLILVLLCVMVLRGSFFTGLLSQPQKDAGKPLYAHEKWSDDAAVTVLGSAFIYGNISGQVTQIGMADAFVTMQPSLNSGEFCITGPYQFDMARNKIFPIQDSTVLSITNGWNSFRDENKIYNFYKLYPDYYYYLFGFWLEGSTGTPYEFPSVYYYYKPSVNEP